MAELGEVLSRGLLPVLHGDAVFTSGDGRGCGILSGDELCCALSGAFRPALCVFLSDVAGVYDRPPENDPAATLIREIRVDRSGRIVGLQAKLETAAHDVTGGLQAKLEAAARIASRGVPVCVCEAATMHAQEALCGRVPQVCTMVVRDDVVFKG
eukprot:4024421-Prymnesium_polylepis.1